MSKIQSNERHGAASVRSPLGIAGLMACLVSGFIGYCGTASATPGSLFASTVIGPTLFDEADVKTHTGAHKVKIQTQGASDVYIVTNIVELGGHSGWHTHPGPSLVSVKSGTATYYDGDDPTCTPKVVSAGDGFVDRGGGHVHLIRNEGNVRLELVAFQIIPQGATRRIDVPNPGNCPF